MRSRLHRTPTANHKRCYHNGIIEAICEPRNELARTWEAGQPRPLTEKAGDRVTQTALVNVLGATR